MSCDSFLLKHPLENQFDSINSFSDSNPCCKTSHYTAFCIMLTYCCTNLLLHKLAETGYSLISHILIPQYSKMVCVEAGYVSKPFTLPGGESFVASQSLQII